MGTQWRISSVGRVCAGIYTIESVVAAGRYLNIDGGETSLGTNVQIWATDSIDSQWRIAEISAGIYAFESVKAVGKYLNIAGSGTSDGTNVQIWGNSDSLDSQWRIREGGSDLVSGSFSVFPSFVSVTYVVMFVLM